MAHSYPKTIFSIIKSNSGVSVVYKNRDIKEGRDESIMAPISITSERY
jgi:hypothetical protein